MSKLLSIVCIAILALSALNLCCQSKPAAEAGNATQNGTGSGGSGTGTNAGDTGTHAP